MTDKIFGASGDRVVIEEFLTGPEVSVLAFCDGRTIKPMASAQDHKRAYDYDKGPNTGGMGAFSPSNKYTDEIADICMNTIFIPTVNAMIAEGCPFRGVIYFGLMLTPKGPRVIEYNARFGDPETQVVLPRMKTDLIDIVLAVNSGTLDKLEIEFSADACACVVAASGGYPVKYEKGFEISGIDKVNGAVVYHAGTTKTGDKYYTSGGRVLCVSALAPTLDEAVKKAYEELKKISFEKMHYRTDIGKK
ncbi:Phosphoribosylamine--glycine ligase [bioreactor metagenome]|uniref:phosphoribosylamine--glycine ligase n=1 Tax=bioreactor metagenome TaxID=1076179 RepID=A0A645AQ26_9ZZZZ